MLSGKRLLVSGIATRESIAAAVVERALREGAEVLVAAYPRDVPMAEEVLSGLPSGSTAVVAVDATDSSAVADAVCFLLSDLARAITGEVLHVDGGVHAMATYLRNSPVEASETTYQPKWLCAKKCANSQQRRKGHGIEELINTNPTKEGSIPWLQPSIQLKRSL